jgi:NAD(P)-dependent dehydrogenase (short-subunit alcohol dehydrogenase family)
MEGSDGRVVVVTGAAMGIGRATAVAFAKAGASVVLADIAAQEGSLAAEEIKAGGSRALFVEADVALSESARQVIQKAVEQFEGVDVLINNVGIQPPRVV